MTSTYISPTVPNHNEWKLCQFHNFVNLGRRGTLDPSGQLVLIVFDDVHAPESQTDR